jgi:hypothetical protein
MPANAPAPQKKLTKKTIPRRDRRRAILVRFLMTTLVAGTMITTGGFGTFPSNGLTDSAAKLVSENFPAQIIQPVNMVLKQASAPTLEVVEHPKSENANPVADTFAALIVPLFPTASKSAPDVTSTAAAEAFQTAVGNAIPTFQAQLTQTAEVAITLTAAPSYSPVGTQATPAPPVTGTVQSNPTSTPQPSQTLEPSSIATLVPTWTTVYLPPLPTNTKKPKPPTDTPIPPTLTPTTTLTPTPTFGPQLIISNVSLNGGGSSISVPPGSPVTITYDFQVMSDGCPGCITQLVTGLGTPGSHGGTCAFNGGAGVFPGVTGAENTTLTMPTAAGTYNVSVRYSWELGCPGALSGYGPGGQVIGQITVNSCAAGLNFVASAPYSAANAIRADWNGTMWTTTTTPNWLVNVCNLPTYNNSGTDISVTFRYASNQCAALTVTAGGGVQWISGDDTVGQCPVELYVSPSLPTSTPTPNPCIASGPVSVSGEQWYYGQTSCSCNNVCAATGVNVTAFNAVDLTKCQSVFDAMFGTGTYTVLNWAGLGNGLGCQFDTVFPAAAWYNDTADPATALGNSQRMCVCNP